WRQFISMLNRALPRHGDTIPMDFNEESEEK
ncbi:unnamed protein product, partial [marine sediment metagenome]